MARHRASYPNLRLRGAFLGTAKRAAEQQESGEGDTPEKSMFHSEFSLMLVWASGLRRNVLIVTESGPASLAARSIGPRQFEAGKLNML